METVGGISPEQLKELLRKAFEAGRDREYCVQWQMGKGKPDFEEWLKEKTKEELNEDDETRNFFDGANDWRG